MFKERSTEKLIEYIQSLPNKEQKLIVKTLTTSKTPKPKTTNSRAESKVLKQIKEGLLEIKASKRTGKKMKTLDEFLNEI